MSHRITSRIPLVALALAAALISRNAAWAQTAPSGVKGEVLYWIQDGEDKLVQLAEAIPESKYGWTPDKGVRTVGEVFMHVASANFGIPGIWGVKPPAGFSFETYEKSLTKKADIIKALKDSFAHVEGALKAAPDADFDKPIKLFGSETTVRGGYLLVMSHVHEHLGQAIAYARSNKVTPPWTAKEQAEEAKSQKK